MSVGTKAAGISMRKEDIQVDHFDKEFLDEKDRHVSKDAVDSKLDSILL